MEERDEELRDREAYIRQLEDAVQHSHSFPSRKSSTGSTLVSRGSSLCPSDIPLPASPFTPALPIEAMEDFQQRASVVDLSPQSSKRLSALKDSLSRLENGETQSRVTELMQSVHDMMKIRS